MDDLIVPIFLENSLFQKLSADTYSYRPTLITMEVVLFRHRTIIQTGILCKKNPCYMWKLQKYLKIMLKMQKYFQVMLIFFEKPPGEIKDISWSMQIHVFFLQET